jgi:hypothetical protein
MGGDDDAFADLLIHGLEEGSDPRKTIWAQAPGVTVMP